MNRYYESITEVHSFRMIRNWNKEEKGFSNRLRWVNDRCKISNLYGQSERKNFFFWQDLRKPRL